MAMGKRQRQRQEPLWVSSESIRGSGHVFYEKLNQILDESAFDDLAESHCARFYAETMGRPGVPPGVYFRMLLVGFFEGIDSERGIAWRCADSISLRRFLGYALDENPPDHSSLSRTRRLIDLETHAVIFEHVQKVLAGKGLIDGKTIGVDATNLEANAAMRSIVRRDTGEDYETFLKRLAEASGIKTPTREDLAKVDKKRKNKASNDDWQSPSDPDARIAKMKDGRTHLAHKAEHAVDLGGYGAILGITLHPADAGDTTTLGGTLSEAREHLRRLAEDEQVGTQLNDHWASEVVLDKGYHSNQTLMDLKEAELRSYISEPDRGRRNWAGKQEQRDAVYANRRRIKGSHGKELMKKRAELNERSNAHLYETGGMRRCWLRGCENITKRLLIHASGFNLSIVMRYWLGKGTPRGLGSLLRAFLRLYQARIALIGGRKCSEHRFALDRPQTLATPHPANLPLAA
jgi:transposase